MRLWKWGSLVLLAWPAAALADVAVPASSPSAIAFLHMHEWLWAIAQGVSLALPVLLLATGASVKLRDACARLARGNRFFTRLLFVAAYLFLAALAVAPVDYWRDVVSEQGFGRPGEAFAPWLLGEAVPLFVKIVVAALFLWIPYWLMRLSPRRWWLWSAAALVPVAFLVLVALPVFVAPLTATYRPLADKVLAEKIETLAVRCGVGGIPIFIGGDDDTVVGLGPTNRIVLEDGIAKRETTDQITFTVGHELKHYVMGDNWKALAIIAGLLFIGLGLVHGLGSRFAFGLGGLSDPAALPLALLFANLLWLAVLPAFNWEARRIEFEADRFGLELTHQNRAAAELFAGWAKGDTQPADFNTFFQLFRQTHPSLGDRIRFANNYKPWEKGEPLAYGEVCR